MKLARIPILCAALLLPRLAAANDSEIEIRGGRVYRVSEGKTKVQMVREAVLLRVDREDSYFVQADFQFRNHGGPTSVKMGFPVWGGDPDHRDPAGWHREFQTSIDGRPAKVRRLRTGNRKDKFDGYWVKEVHFGRGQTRRIHVQCRAPNGANTSDLRKSCIYWFTGGNWFGKVKESVLTLRFSKAGSYAVRPCWNETKAEVWRDGADLKFRWRNWQADEGQEFDFGNSPPNWLQWNGYNPPETGTLEVTVPGVSTGPYSLETSGFVVGGKAYISLAEWINQTRDRQFLGYRAGSKGIELYNGKEWMLIPWCDSGSDAPRYLVTDYGRRLYVPVSLLSRGLKIRFRVDSRRHFIEQVFEKK